MMNDFIGRDLQVGDYVFGGEPPDIWKIVAIDPNRDYYGEIIRAGQKLTKHTLLYKYIKLSNEEATTYYLQKDI